MYIYHLVFRVLKFPIWRWEIFRLVASLPLCVSCLGPCLSPAVCLSLCLALFSSECICLYAVKSKLVGWTCIFSRWIYGLDSGLTEKVVGRKSGRTGHVMADRLCHDTGRPCCPLGIASYSSRHCPPGPACFLRCSCLSKLHSARSNRERGVAAEGNVLSVSELVQQG